MSGRHARRVVVKPSGAAYMWRVTDRGRCLGFVVRARRFEWMPVPIDGQPEGTFRSRRGAVRTVVDTMIGGQQ